MIPVAATQKAERRPPGFADRANILFDLDGTLVDTRDAVVACYSRVFRTRLQREFRPEQKLSKELFAMRPRELFDEVAPEAAAELLQAYSETYPQCLSLVRVFPRVAEMLAGLKASGRRASLVTNKGLERTLLDLSVAGIDVDGFAAIVTAEDTAERKPQPEPILLGMERAGAGAADSLYIGDGPQDVLAARAAGIPCIAVSYGFYESAVLEGCAPDAIVGSAEELARLLGVDPER